MDDPLQNVSSCDSESHVFSVTASSAVDNLVSCSSTEITLPTAVVTRDSHHASVTSGISSKNIENTDGHNCMPSEFVDSNFNFDPASSHSEASNDGREQYSMLIHDVASSANDSPTSVRCSEEVAGSVDSEVYSCAPIVTVGGTNEKELKRGLEQRLGLVLTKLARENDEDAETAQVAEAADDQHKRQSLQTSDDSVVNESEPREVGRESDASAVDPKCVLMMDIVQEMDEVERYSYISLVAYAMHQLFEFSKWNQYVTFCLIDTITI